MRANATPAMEHSLIRGLMEQLPPVGSVFDLSSRGKWRSLAEAVFAVLYCEDQGDTPGVTPALPAPVIEEVKAVPVEARPTKFAAKLAGRKSGAGRSQKAPADRVAKLDQVHRMDGGSAKPTAREIVLMALRSSDRPLTVKEMVTVAEVQCGMDLSGFRDVRAAIGAQVPRMDLAKEIVLADVSGMAKRYALPLSAKST